MAGQRSSEVAAVDTAWASGQSGSEPVVYSTTSFTESLVGLPAGRNPLVTYAEQL